MTLWVSEVRVCEVDAHGSIADKRRAIGVSMKVMRRRGSEDYVRRRRREVLFL